MRRGAPLAGMLQMATVARYACPLEETHMQPTSAKPIQQHAPDPQDYLMRIADLLSDDPFLLTVLGGSFKVSAEYDANCHDPCGSPWMMEDTGGVRASAGRGRSIL